MSTAVQKTAAEEALGFQLPHRRMEDWRWTDLRQMIDKPYPPRQQVTPAAGEVDRLLGLSLFARRGGNAHGVRQRRVRQRALEAGQRIRRRQAAIDEPVNLMNVAFATDGARLRIEGNVDTPIELVFIATDAAPRAIATRNVIEIADDASATIIETHVGAGSYLANSVTELRVGNNARLDRVKVELESHDAVHLAHTHVALGHSVTFRDFTLTTGAKLNRQNGTFRFGGEDPDAKVSGAFCWAAGSTPTPALV